MWINMSMSSRNMKQHHHLLHYLGCIKCMRLTTRHHRIPNPGSPPVVLQIVPLSLQCQRMHEPRMLVSGENAGLLDTENVYEAAVACVEEKGTECYI